MDNLAYWEGQAAVDPDFAAWAAGDSENGITSCLAQIPEPKVSGEVLDLGCGPGRLLAPWALSHPGRSCHGVDISPGMTSHHRLRLPSITIHVTDGLLLPPLPPLALAWSVLMFQHIPDDQVRSYIRQVSNRLVPRGLFTFQYVVGDQDLPLNHHRSMHRMEAWVAHAGMTTINHVIAIHEQWAWLTCEK